MALRCACPLVSNLRTNLRKLACLGSLTCTILAAGQVKTDVSAPSAWSGKGRMYYVELKKTLNAEKLKAGDPVEFSLLEPTLLTGRIVAPRNARLHGHVVDVQAYDRESKQASRLSVVVDSIKWKQTTVPVCASIAGFGTREFKFTRDPWPIHPPDTTNWATQQSQSELIAGRRSLGQIQSATGLTALQSTDLFRDDPPNVVQAGDGFIKDLRIQRDPMSPSVLARRDKSIKLLGGTLIALEELSPAGNACLTTGLQ